MSDIRNKLENKLEEILEKKNPSFLLDKPEEVQNSLFEEEKKEEKKEKEPEAEKLPTQKGTLEDKIIAFFSENPNAEDAKLHKWAEEQKLNVHEVETAIYALTTKMVKFLTGGMSVKKGVSAKSVDSTELRMGKGVEKEHTSDEDTAERIAVDHLSEIPDYYTRLKKMEDEAKVKEEPKKKEEVSEGIKVESLKKFDKSRTQTAVKRAIDTIFELVDEGVFEGNEKSYMESALRILNSTSRKLKQSII